MTKNFDSNDFSSFVSSRRSTRDFQSTPVPDEIIEEIIADGLTSPSWSNTRPFVVAVAKGDVKDRISKDFLSRFESIKNARGEGWFAKIKAIFRRKGLPTSNWLVIKPYHKDLMPRSRRVGKEMLTHIGIERDDKEKDAFVHASAVKAAGMRFLNEGDKLEFTLEDGPKGPSAVNLKKLD